MRSCKISAGLLSAHIRFKKGVVFTSSLVILPMASAWPLSSPSNEWRLNAEGFLYGVYAYQSGSYGTSQGYETGRMKTEVSRSWNRSSLIFRNVLSSDPLMGARGYAQRFQTGGTADGRTPLVDRQEPDDFISELSAQLRLEISESQSIHTYWALPGMPCLGPGEFSEDIPDVPLGHHWQNNSDISYGVATGGYQWNAFTLEGSVFRGREPDNRHWDIEKARFDSWASRVSASWRPWTAQASFGRLHSPEQLSPMQDQERASLSLSYDHDSWTAPIQATLAFGRVWPRGIRATDSVIFECIERSGASATFFQRYEYLENDHLIIGGSPLVGPVLAAAQRHQPFTTDGGIPVPIRFFPFHKFTLGARYDFWHKAQATLGFGASASFHLIPKILTRVYGDTPATVSVFLRLALGGRATQIAHETNMTPKA